MPPVRAPTRALSAAVRPAPSSVPDAQLCASPAAVAADRAASTSSQAPALRRNCAEAIDEVSCTTPLPIRSGVRHSVRHACRGKGCFKKTETRVRLLVQVGAAASIADAVADAWRRRAARRIRMRRDSACCCSSRPAWRRRKTSPPRSPSCAGSPAAPDRSLMPVDVRDWEALFPPDTPAPCGPSRAAAARQALNGTGGRRPYRTSLWPLIETHDLWKTYVMGDEEIHALRGVSIQHRARRIRRHHGPVRLGQVDADEPHRLPRHAVEGQLLLNGKEVAAMNDDELARIRNEEIGFVFQTFNLLPRATALHNVELPLIYAGVSGKDRIERAKAGAREGRADLARDAPAERALGRSAAARRDRPRAGEQPVDPARRRADGQPRLQDRRRNHGASSIDCTRRNTIVLVTHEPDIAAYAHRVDFTSATARSRRTCSGRRRGSRFSGSRVLGSRVLGFSGSQVRRFARFAGSQVRRFRFGGGLLPGRGGQF